MSSPSPTERDLLRFTVAELLERWPTAAQVFIAYRLACIGCDFSAFHTLAEVKQEYPRVGGAVQKALMQITHSSDPNPDSDSETTPQEE
jgi:hypothetical protein